MGLLYFKGSMDELNEQTQRGRRGEGMGTEHNMNHSPAHYGQTITIQLPEGRSLYERIKEHMRCWSEKSEESCLHAHSEKCHDGGQFLIEIKLLKECYGKPTARMVSEAVLIEDLPVELSLNSKAEWNYISLPRVTVS